MATSSSSFDIPEERLHDWSLRYVRLKAIVLLLRSLNSLRPLIYRTQTPLPHGFERQVVDLPSRQSGRTIRVHIYRSKLTSPSSDGVPAPLPVHISWHGSGFVLPNLGDDYAYASHILNKLGPDCIFIDADYRKAPEYPFPAASHDAQDVVNNILSQPQIYDPDRITLGGFSAGGNLALVVGAQLGPQRIAGIAALYPPVDFTIRPQDRPLASKVRPDSGFPLPTWMSNVFIDSYFVRQQDKEHPLCSVYYLHAARFPPLLLASGQLDTLHRASEKLVRKLADAGRTDVRFISIQKEGHGFDKLPRGPESIKRRDYVYDQFAHFLKQSSSRSSAHQKAQL
ncbi:related to lipase/esterase [Ustilago bromivora]|uniref:Related to lipase/esterase n=1 Tax=Ustilago bromivora TaxID=307758 RepID=A0A1K0GRU9_9BASI|nr:related to lipase/esterase [Ustilago bromivora]SYW82829.1 related to lipase/esterase [Ustilago bromivora]